MTNPMVCGECWHLRKHLGGWNATCQAKAFQLIAEGRPTAVVKLLASRECDALPATVRVAVEMMEREALHARQASAEYSAYRRDHPLPFTEEVKS
jgi:hypothetical protein